MIRKKGSVIVLAVLLAVVLVLAVRVTVRAGLQGQMTETIPADETSKPSRDLFSGNPSDARVVGNETCAKCHPTQTGAKPAEPGMAPPPPPTKDEVRKVVEQVGYDMGSVDPNAWNKNVHSKVGNSKECETCHGPSSKHNEANTREFTTNPRSLSWEDQSKLCLSCHFKSNFPSQHGGARVSCLDCHQLHRTDNPNYLKNPNVNEVCFQCHTNVKNEFEMPSHHPVTEEKMTCTQCHNPHFTVRQAAYRESRMNELCWSCHTEYRGPYLYGHPPVEEDCRLCHKPHGSVNRQLLTNDTPFLCLQCHPFQMQFHKEGELSNDCNMCHVSIHGSNVNAMFHR